jgi:hypothetical protein
MTKVLITAEDFGFGPVAKLHAICVELARRGVEYDFVGSGAALTFASSNKKTFSSITALDEMTGLAAIDPSGYDAAISVMDPFLALLSSQHGIPCVYVDSLYWFWQWSPEREPTLRDQAAKLRTMPSAAHALAALGRIPMHDSQYIAHHLSTVTCAQRAPKAMDRTRTLRGIGNVHLVDAIIDLSQRRPGCPTQWLATTSGMLNPLVPAELAVDWVRIVAHLIGEAADDIGTAEPILLVGNPAILALADDVASDRIQPVPMDHGAMLRAMNESFACLMPPGLTTLMESAAYGVPVAFLPEQHYAHASNYREVVACGGSVPFPHALVNPTADSPRPGSQFDETLSVLGHLREQFDEHGVVWSRMVSGLASGMCRVLDDRHGLWAAQDSAVRRFVGGYNGSAEVVDVLQAAVESPTGKRAGRVRKLDAGLPAL